MSYKLMTSICDQFITIHVKNGMIIKSGGLSICMITSTRYIVQFLGVLHCQITEITESLRISRYTLRNFEVHI